MKEKLKSLAEKYYSFFATIKSFNVSMILMIVMMFSLVASLVFFKTDQLFWAILVGFVCLLVCLHFVTYFVFLKFFMVSPINKSKLFSEYSHYYVRLDDGKVVDMLNAFFKKDIDQFYAISEVFTRFGLHEFDKFPQETGMRVECPINYHGREFNLPVVLDFSLESGYDWQEIIEKIEPKERTYAMHTYIKEHIAEAVKAKEAEIVSLIDAILNMKVKDYVQNMEVLLCEISDLIEYPENLVFSNWKDYKVSISQLHWQLMLRK